MSITVLEIPIDPNNYYGVISYMYLYCVYFTTYSGNSELPPFYIGSTSVSNIEKGYNGSVISNKWNQLWNTERKLHPELFHTEIVSCYETRKEAYDVEFEFQWLEQVVSNPLYINESYANWKFSTTGLTHSVEARLKNSIAKTGKNHPNYGKPRSKETIQKIKIANTGKTRTSEQKQTLSDALKGRVAHNKGKPHSEETKQKIGRKPVMCVELNKVFVSCREAAEFIGGYKGGVAEAASGKRKTAGGYHWKYLQLI